MTLPIRPPWPPMEARTVEALPAGGGWQYEPKWDGFRAIVFKDGDVVQIQSKAGQPLARYFPDLVQALRALRPERFVLDGEIVVPIEGGFSFDDLLQRIHPASSRVERLSVETPARLLVFDLLVDARGRLLTGRPLSERRPRLEDFARAALDEEGAVRLSPATEDLDAARRWLEEAGAERDGVVAKRLDRAYLSGEREGMVKVKRRRTADCVVGGFRYGKAGGTIGSLLLGLYGDDGLLHHAGFVSSLSAAEKRRLTPEFEALVEPPGFTGRAPGGPSRWSRTRENDTWQPVRPERVVEVEYDHFTNGRFRHGTKFLRWRPDKAPEQCTFEQVRRQVRAAAPGAGKRAGPERRGA